MPYKFQTDKKLIPADKDKRIKLTADDREQIKKRNSEGISQRALAREYGVSRRLIQFIIHPEKHTANIEARKKRGGSKQYYDKNKNTEYMRTHRHYKKMLDDEALLLENEKRNKEKETMESRCLTLMVNNPKFCGDDIYSIVCKIIEDDFKISITPEIVTKIRTINRSRQKVLERYPTLDRRKKMQGLQENDKKYYGKGE